MRSVFWVRTAGVLVALFAASFFSFPSFPNAGIFGSRPPLSVNRALKGDRLPSISPAIYPHELGSPLSPGSAARARIPVGCDAAFSSISTPRFANVFRRCIA